MKLTPAICQHCGTAFMAQSANAGRFCTPQCYWAGRTVPIETRFWQHVDRGAANSCWLWTGPAARYARIYAGKALGYVGAHRIAWMLAHPDQQIPSGLCICHVCDVRLCCNPQHLFLGTVKDNTTDKVMKGRQPRGSQSSRAKLDEIRVQQVLRLHADGASIRGLGRQFGVSHRTIQQIIQRKTWQHVAA